MLGSKRTWTGRRDTDEWELTDTMSVEAKLTELFRLMMIRQREGGFVGIPIKDPAHDQPLYGFVMLRMDDIVSWEGHGLFDAAAVGPWSELQSEEGGDDSG